MRYVAMMSHRGHDCFDSHTMFGRAMRLMLYALVVMFVLLVWASTAKW